MYQLNLIVDSRTHHYTQTVIIKLLRQNLMLKSIVPHLNLKFDTIKIQMMILSEGQLISSTGKELTKTKI